MLSDKLGYVDGPAERGNRSGAVAEIVAVLQSHGDNIHRPFMSEFLVGFKCNVEDSLAQWQQRMLGTMFCLGKERQRIVVVEHLHAFADNLFVLLYRGKAVADTENGQHLQKGEGLLQQRPAEDVRTGHEYGGAVHGTQYHQCVQQCAGVVAADDDGAVFGNIFFTLDRKSAKRHVYDWIDQTATQECVEKIFMVNLHGSK